MVILAKLLYLSSCSGKKRKKVAGLFKKTKTQEKKQLGLENEFKHSLEKEINDFWIL